MASLGRIFPDCLESRDLKRPILVSRLESTLEVTWSSIHEVVHSRCFCQPRIERVVRTRLVSVREPEGDLPDPKLAFKYLLDRSDHPISAASGAQVLRYARWMFALLERLEVGGEHQSSVLKLKAREDLPLTIYADVKAKKLLIRSKHMYHYIGGIEFRRAVVLFPNDRFVRLVERHFTGHKEEVGFNVTDSQANVWKRHLKWKELYSPGCGLTPPAIITMTKMKTYGSKYQLFFCPPYEEERNFISLCQSNPKWDRDKVEFVYQAVLSIAKGIKYLDREGLSIPRNIRSTFRLYRFSEHTLSCGIDGFDRFMEGAEWNRAALFESMRCVENTAGVYFSTMQEHSVKALLRGI